MEFPPELTYCQTHEWVKQQDSDTLLIGISDFAQSELGDVVYVELPAVGEQVKQGDPFCSLESVKAVSDVYAPLSGEVLAINQALADDPSLLNSAPYTDGWLIALKPEDGAQVANPLSADEYRSQVTEGG